SSVPTDLEREQAPLAGRPEPVAGAVVQGAADHPLAPRPGLAAEDVEHPHAADEGAGPEVRCGEPSAHRYPGAQAAQGPAPWLSSLGWEGAHGHRVRLSRSCNHEAAAQRSA